jgi:hypothetical protein
MRRVALIISALAVFACGTSAWASLDSGSLSTPLLFDSNSYGIADSTKRPLATEISGGLIATAAWYNYGMKLDWTVTQIEDKYLYHYCFGPGWYPAANGSGGGNPYVTNKSIYAWDIQFGAGMTLADLENPVWNVYRFDGARLGSGDATNWYSYNPTTGVVNSSGTATLLAVGELVGSTGYMDPLTGEQHYLDNQQLFHGLQWLDPIYNGNFKFSGDVNFDLTFTSAYAPGWGNFFANSDTTGSNNNNSRVVAYNSLDTGYDPAALAIPVHFSNKVAVAGGTPDVAPVPIPAALPLFGSGLAALGLLRRKFFSV